MAEQLEIVIGANVDDAKAGINSLGQTINQFAQQGKISIGVLEQSLAQLRAQIKLTTDPVEAQKLGQAFKAVQDQINQLKLNDGLSQQLGGVTRATRVAHTELEGVSLELRNLASGNSSAIDSLGRLAFNFQRLGGIAGGAGGALSSIGEALLGPAGLILAFTTLVPLIVSFVGDLLDSESAAKANQQAFDDLNQILKDSKTSFEQLQTQVKLLDQIGPVNLEINFGKGFKADILDLNARVLELNDLISQQQKIITDAQNATAAAQKAFDDDQSKENKKQKEDAIKTEEDANKELVNLTNERLALYRKTALERIQNQRETDQKVADDAKKAQEELNRQLIALAREAEKAFSIPLRLKFDSTDLDVDKLQKARDIIAGIRDFTIKAKIDIVLPDIKELPKEQVEKFFKNVPNALQDAVNKGLIEAEGKELKIDLGPFSKEIQAELDKFNQAGLKIPVTFDLKDADLLKKLRDTFEIEKIQASIKFDPNSITESIEKLKTALTTQQVKDIITLSLSLNVDPIILGEAIQRIKTFLPDKLQGELDIAIKAGNIDTTGLLQDLAKMNENITKSLKDSLAQLGSELGDFVGQAIGDALSGGDISNAFKDFGNAVGSLVEAFGKQMVALGIAAALASKALKTLFANPAAAIAAGVALIAIGEALKNLLSGGLKGFEKGGRPPVGEWVIVGEKGPELMKFDQPGRIYSNSDSRSLLSSSVQQYESIKEYLIAEKISQQVKEHFNTAFRSIETSVKILATNNDRLATYSYQLHNNIQSLKESFVDRSSTDTIQKLNESVNNLKESFASVSDKSTINNIVEKLTETVNNFKESSTDNNRFERLSQLVSDLKESFVSVITNNTSSTADNDHLVNNYKESFDKVNTSIKETISYLTASINDKSATIDKSSHYENSFDNVENINEKVLTDHFSTSNNSFTASLKELQSLTASSIDRLHESVINNNVTASIDKLHEKISERSDKSVHIERIINNNFFTSESFKESFKSMSISDLQRTFNIPAFAQGGAVFGPTLAILGEGFGISRSNPEFVGTASQLKGIQGGQFDVNVSVGGELSFSMGKLAIALNREVRSQLRTNGKPPF